MKFRCDAIACAGHRSRFAVAVAGPVIRTDTSKFRDLRLHTNPCVKRICEPGFQYDRGAPFSGAINIELELAGIYQMTETRKSSGIGPKGKSLVASAGQCEEGHRQQDEKNNPAQSD